MGLCSVFQSGQCRFYVMVVRSVQRDAMNYRCALQIRSSKSINVKDLGYHEIDEQIAVSQHSFQGRGFYVNSI